MRIVLFSLAMLAGSAKADPTPVIYDTFVQVNIYYGVSQLYSPANVLLSTIVDMTVETQFDYAAVQAAGEGAFVPFFMPLMDQVVVAQLPAGVPSVPSYILNNLASFENSDGFGAALDMATSVYPPDPNGSPSPTALALYQALTTEPVPSAVTSDSGFVELGANFDYVFAFGPYGPLPGTVAGTIEGGTNLQIFERDLQLQETTPAPEPRSLGLLAVAIGLVLWKRVTKARIVSRQISHLS